MKSLQSVGQSIGEVLRQLDEDKCRRFLPGNFDRFPHAYLVIVKTSSGPRWVVGCRSKLDKAKLKPGTRVTLDMTTLTIMRALPREVDPLVYNMVAEEPGAVSCVPSLIHSSSHCLTRALILLGMVMSVA